MTSLEAHEIKTTLQMIRDLCSEMAERVRAHYPERGQTTAELDRALAAASEVWRVNITDILSHRRPELLLEPRYAVYRWMNRRFGLSETGRVMGRDHAAVRNGVMRCQTWIDNAPNGEFARRVKRFEEKMGE